MVMVLSVLSVTVMAVTPQFWENFRKEDLLKGSLKGVSLSYDGKLFLAPAYDLVYDTGQPYIFSMVRDKAGNLYVGTGDGGKVFKVDPAGKGSLYFQAEELNVFALALDDSNNLYVGTSPDGKVYKVTGADQSTEFCDPDEKYIWAMDLDKNGNLYVATGGKGVIYKVNKEGEKSEFFTCGDNHVMCLTRSSNDNLLAGTSPEGYVIEITSKGKGFTLLDTPMQEVHSIAVDRFGTIYAVASSSGGSSTTPPAKPESEPGTTTVTSATTILVQAVVGPSQDAKETATPWKAAGAVTGAAEGRSAIYTIAGDGGTETFYESNSQMVFDVLTREDGSLLAATGSKGRLLTIDVDKQVGVISDTPEEDLTQLVAAGAITYVGGSNQGKIYKLQSRRARSGAFESETLDAKTVASWGKFSWHVLNPESASIELSTRSGNTEEPDNSWSDWSAAYTKSGVQITSPRARYFQWRASFKQNSGPGRDGTDILDRIQIAYLQQNLRPRVDSIEVLPFGVELQKQPSLAVGGFSITTQEAITNGRSLNSPRERSRDRQVLAPRQVLQPGAQAFTWKASDDNKDDLEYSLYFRGEGESDWKLLEKGLEDTFYTLSTASLPDGIYRLKVVASDAPSNPYDQFLIGESISDPFVIANTSPQVEITSHKVNGKKVEMQFHAVVRTGRIATAEFSIDGGEWLLAFPEDGIADSTQESYRITTPELSIGEHLIGVRASDGDGNTGTTKVVVEIP